MKRDTPTYQFTLHPLFPLEKEILSSPVNAGKYNIFKIHYLNFENFYLTNNYKIYFRPLSKTVRFNTLRVIPNEIIGSVRKQFMLF